MNEKRPLMSTDGTSRLLVQVGVFMTGHVVDTELALRDGIPTVDAPAVSVQ